MRLVDLTGQKFNRLTVIERHSSNNAQNKPMWVCECECGNKTIVGGSELKTGNTKSCGCLNRELAKNRLFKHGMKHTKLYYVWCGMKDRCYNPKNKRYKDYGGRGIKMDETWKHDFTSFYTWAMENGYQEGLSIDRANNNEGYFPFNCVWSTVQRQNRNKRNTVHSQIYLKRNDT
jgi:hypothetical protein